MPKIVFVFVLFLTKSAWDSPFKAILTKGADGE